MKNRKYFLIISLLLLSILVMTGCSGQSVADDEDIEIYLACDSQEDTVTYLFMQEFAKLVEEKSDGRVKASLYPNAQIGGDNEIAEAIQNGNITFVVQNTAPQVNFIPELAIMDAPNIFQNKEVAREVLDGPFFEELQKMYEENNFYLLAMADQGFRTMTSNKKVESIDDFNGIKIRTMENPFHIRYWKSIGANPTPMNFGEVYIGLQQGTIDAQENPLETTVAAKLYEQQDYVVETNHVLHGLSLIGSPVIIDRFPEDIKEIIYEAADEAKVYARQKTDERAEGRIQIIIDSGTEIVTLAPEVLAEMRENAQSVYTAIEEVTGTELMDTLFQEVETAELKLGLNNIN